MTLQIYEAQLSLAQRFRIAKARAQRLLAHKLFDESQHPRDEHGRWTDSGSTDDAAIAFISPNVENLKIDGAIAGLHSARQEALRKASAEVDVKLGKNPVAATSVVGAWSDGAENSLQLKMPKGWSFDQAKVAMAMKGWLGDQKSALVFKPDSSGNAFIASFPMTGKLDEIHKQLLDDGLAFHTLEPTSEGAVVHVYGDDQATHDTVAKALETHDTQGSITFGHGAFIGTAKQDGTDREQRDDARSQYEAIIRDAQGQSTFEGRDIGKIWDDIRARWGGELSPQAVTDSSVPGHRLTSNAIIAEAGKVKPNSVRVADVAKQINERAGAILKADLGVDHIDLKNRTDETDDYLSGVIAQELKDGLTNGRSAVDWYDRTMKSAMASAEKLYPGIKSDPDQRFAYTAALAISSQGEVVDSTVRLADQAYKHFAEHGRFPTDIEAKDPNIGNNLKKVNALIDKMGIVKTREFFNTQMTSRDLKKATGVDSGLGVDDMVYGSAMLGPKIGQGFYQNLNGNFSPITMDMWFMRSWGRLTNTGIGYQDMAPLYERLDNALVAEGEKVPKSEAAKVKLAREIVAQHEKDYKEHKAEYKSGERKKSELVYASERIDLSADGAMVEQPSGVKQRQWITSVFHNALDKLNAEGIRMQPASAQATWWWPEQVLYDKLGARVRENDNDYAKSLKKLADSRGLKQFDYAQGLQFAPWINDPDPPDYQSDDEIEAMADSAASFFGIDKSQAWQLARAQAQALLARAKKPKTKVELWPEENEKREDFMDRCVTAMTKCVGKEKAPRVCGRKWRKSEKLGKKGLVTREAIEAEDDAELLIEPCGKACIACEGADAPFLKQWRIERDKAQAWLKEWDENKHPRVPAGSPDGGQFGEGGGGGSGSSPDIADGHLDPKVVEVGGDAWNKATARRLEREYQTAKPKLDDLLDKVTGGAEAGPIEPISSTGAVPKVDDESEPQDEEEPDEGVYVPESWEEMNDNDQEDVKQEYYSKKLSDYEESEQQSWYDNGGALDEAKAQLAGPDFVHDTVKEYMTEKDDDGEPFTETKFPYTVDQLAKAIVVEYESDGSGTGKLDIGFDATELMEPIGSPPKEQGTLPGIEPEDLSKRLTKEMRDELSKVLTEKFDEQAEKNSSDVEPPSYLADQAKEFMEENWEHNMSDADKFGFAKYETSIIKDLQEMVDAGNAAVANESVSGRPDKFDPLNETTGNDYKKTQRLARLLSIERAKQVMKDRGIEFGAGVNPTLALNRVDNKLWAAWKSSSTSIEGQLLQVATADELGGRLNPKTGHGGKVELDRDKIIYDADGDYKFMGGYKGVLAYVRAKWETTQFLLDQAGISELQLYRGIALDPDKFAQAEREKLLSMKQMVEGHAKVPNLNVVRNGAASTSVKASVSNGWSSDATRVVLRAYVPRTAAVSVPAYGINVQSEQEVVVAGTAWKAWDAWIGKAPDFEKVKLAA
jgi:hypothetical protein